MTEKYRYQEDEYKIPYHYLTDHRKLINLPDNLAICPTYLSRLEIVKSLLDPLNNKKILDAGCGDGRFLFELRNDCVELYGIDHSQKALHFSRSFNPNAKIILADLTKQIPLPDEYFDDIVFIETLEHIEPYKIATILGEFRRVLKKDGRLIITVPHKNKTLSEKHYQHFDSGSLKETLLPFFQIESLYGNYRKSIIRIGFFYFICWLYYSAFLFKFSGINISDKLGEWGNLFFREYLSECKPDGGFCLIAVCKVVH